MAYADQLDKEGIDSQYLVIIKPRRLVDSASWALISGTKYSQTFSLGQIVALTNDGSSETEASSSALSDGTWYHDTTDNTLYIDISADPSNVDVVATYEIYLGTFDAHFYRVPTNSSTRTVYFEPLITQSPDISQSASEVLSGFLPGISTSISISNATQFLQQHVYESSFNNVAIAVYHYLGELTVANTKLIISGYCGNVRYSDQQTSIEIYDTRALFDKEFRHVDGLNFYASATLPNVDPDYEGRPVRRVYGVIDGFIPVNIDFNAGVPSAIDNRQWICLNPHTNLGSITATVPASPTSTTTRTYLDSAEGFRVDDSVWLDKSTDEYVLVTNVNTTGDNYIEHAALSSGAAASGDFAHRSFIGSVTVLRDGYAPLVLRYKRDYDEYTDATNKLAGFSLNNNFEANYTSSTEPFNGTSSPAYLVTTDLVYCRVYGNTNQETLGGSGFGSDSTTTGNLTQGIVIAYSLFKNHVGLAESELDTATFTSLQSSVTDQLSFAIPEQGTSQFPTYRDIFAKIFQTLLLKFLIDDSNKYTIKRIGPLGSADKTIEDDEILLNNFDYNFDYKDIISDIIVEYDASEVNAKGRTGELFYSNVTSTSALASRLHGVIKQKSFQSYHFIASEAQTLADRIKYALGDRRGTIKIRTKNRFFDTEINDVITMTRSRMPGFAFDAETDRDRKGSVISAKKSLRDIEIELDDQKGIEDNSGSW